LLFQSREFLLLFLPVVFLAHQLIRGRRHENLVLLVASYVFYAAWDWRFTGLILLSTAVDWIAVRAIVSTASPHRRRLALACSIVANLGVLGFFKYSGFATEVASTLLEPWLSTAIPVLDVVLPVGISFYTFQSMSYTIDVYRGEVEPAQRFSDFACYVALFPQLVAGPIVRFSQIHRELESDRRVRSDDLAVGLQTFAVGLCKKVIFADGLAEISDPIFAQADPGFAAAWVGAFAFTIQIYLDFSGYSDMAIGLGRAFGFRFPANFDAPFRATGIRDFWRRWHISLSTWLRDYLYRPLGGNRGSRFALYRNLMLTMALGGLWHGAAWTFVVWGTYHGMLLCGERALPERLTQNVPRFAKQILTFVLVMIGFVVFRSSDMPSAARMLLAMASPLTGSFAEPTLWSAFLVVGGSLVTFGAGLAPEIAPYRSWRAVAVTALLLVLGVAFGFQGEYTPFIYFQF